MHVMARRPEGFNIQAVPGSVGSSANFVSTLFKTCVL